MRNEAAIKCALIDRLFDKGEVRGDAVLISEMVVDDWARRADLVLANGKLCAFEVKSDYDSLVRLQGQVETYRQIFEKVIVVVTPRFAVKAEALIPNGVGLWSLEGQGADTFKIIRSGRTEPLSTDAALSLMTVTDLRALLSSNGFDGASRASRSELEQMAKSLSRKDLAEAARGAVKKRYRNHHQRFVTHREKRNTVSALRFLKRPQRRQAKPNADATQFVALPTISLPSNHPALIHAAVGPILRRLRC